MGQVVQGGSGQAPARQALIQAGLPATLPALTINKVCGSGLKAVMLASQAIKAGDAEVRGRGRAGVDVQRAALRLRHARRDQGRQPDDGGRHDPRRPVGLLRLLPHGRVRRVHRGEGGGEPGGPGRVRRRQPPQGDGGRGGGQVQGGDPARADSGQGGPVSIAADESPRKDTSPDTLARLKPVFRKDGGTVTAGNAPGLNDGASALVVSSLAFAKAHGLAPLARVTAYATGGGEPREIFFAPVVAVRGLMARTGTGIGDYDLIEANEAFAVQAIADGRELGWDWDRVNVNGGAVALGHPIGASGARVLTTLLYALRDRGASTGLATLCLGGGNAVALSVERI